MTIKEELINQTCKICELPAQLCICENGFRRRMEAHCGLCFENFVVDVPAGVPWCDMECPECSKVGFLGEGFLTDEDEDDY